MYIFLGTFAVFAVSLEIWRQRSLRDFDALYVVPILAATLLVGNVGIGGICFNEFDDLGTGKALMLWIAVLVCVAGVVVLSSYEGCCHKKYKSDIVIVEQKSEGKGDGKARAALECAA
jgi:positive regulator of sigma E activity